MTRKITNLILILVLLSASSLFAGFKETDKLLVEAKKEAGEITPQKLKKMIDNEEEVVVLDIREREQRAEGQIYADDTYAITRGNLEFHVMNKIKNKDAVIVTYCRGGSRGALAAQTLRRLGYKNATNLKGGLKGWAKAGYQVETGFGVTRLAKEE
ncbi:MAG: sulfurtransferase [Sulfurimonas sp.]|nr:MAG: sulfurtransferase [Sulfurimonas sp.]